MDHGALSASVFHKHAERYQEKFMDLTLYDESYREFCELLPRGRARVLDAACGPGNVSRYLMAQRPNLDLLGIDLAPRMVQLAREAVPSAQFAVHDCRHLAGLKRRFDGIICAFGLPYIPSEETVAFIREAYQILEPDGVLYLSTMLGRSEDSGFERCSTGDQVYINYHNEQQIICSLQAEGRSSEADPDCQPKRRLQKDDGLNCDCEESSTLPQATLVCAFEEQNEDDGKGRESGLERQACQKKASGVIQVEAYPVPFFVERVHESSGKGFGELFAGLKSAGQRRKGTSCG
jgi:ubiquinone/menaquinone biosynthesis C-methylase UbiE